MVCLKDLSAASVFHFDSHLAVFGQTSFAFYHCDIVFLHKMSHSLAHICGNRARTFDDCVHVWLERAFYLDTVSFRMFDIVECLCRFQQCLGGNTTPVETNSSQVLSFDNCSVKSQLRCPDCGNISSRTAAYNHHIVFHFLSSVFVRFCKDRKKAAEKKPEVSFDFCKTPFWQNKTPFQSDKTAFYFNETPFCYRLILNTIQLIFKAFFSKREKMPTFARFFKTK